MMRDMKRLTILLIGLVIAMLTYFSDIALSKVEQENWTNYIQTWETKWTLPGKRAGQENHVALNKTAKMKNRVAQTIR